MTADQLDLFDLMGESVPLRRIAEPIPAGDPEPGNNCDCEDDGDWHPYGSGGCLGAYLAERQRGGSPA